MKHLAASDHERVDSLHGTKGSISHSANATSEESVPATFGGVVSCVKTPSSSFARRSGVSDTDKARQCWGVLLTLPTKSAICTKYCIV